MGRLQETGAKKPASRAVRIANLVIGLFNIFFSRNSSAFKHRFHRKAEINFNFFPMKPLVGKDKTF
jgi:hypothetical protein